MDVLAGTGPLLILAILLLLFWVVARQRRAASRPVAQPDRGLAYLCNATPFAKADAALLDRFPALRPAAAAAPAGAALTLLRVGLFNRSGGAVAEEDFADPVALLFAPGATVLHAAFAEALKTDLPASAIRIDGAAAQLPAFALAAGGTVIVNLLVAGAAEPVAVRGGLRASGPIQRLM